MKYLQPFSLFESESPKRNLSDALWDLLVSRVTFPELCETDTVAWSCIIDLYSHDEYLESYENNFDEDEQLPFDPMEEEEYSNWCFKYRPSDDQMAYDYFMKCLYGYSDWCEEHHDESLEWYTERFGVSPGLGMILKVWNSPVVIDPRIGNGPIELWSAMDEFPEVFQPFLKDRVDKLIANWNSRIANEVRTKAPSLWKEVIKVIDPTEAETLADLGDLGF